MATNDFAILEEMRKRNLISADQFRQDAQAVRSPQSPYRAARAKGDRGFGGYLTDVAGAADRNIRANTNRAMADIAEQTEEGPLGSFSQWGRETIGNPVREFLGFDPLPATLEERKAALQPWQEGVRTAADSAESEAAALNAPPMSYKDVRSVFDVPEYVASTMAQAGPYMAPTIAAGGLGPLISGLNAAGEGHSNVDDIEGLDQQTKVRTAIGTGAVVAALDMIGLGVLGRSFTGLGAREAAREVARRAGESAARAFVRAMAQTGGRVAGASAAEGVTEALQEGVYMAGREMAGGDFSPGEVQERLAESFFGGAGAGAGFSGVGNAAPATVRTAQDAGRAVQGALDPVLNPERAARQKVLSDLEAGGNAIEDVRGLEGRGGGQMRMADLNLELQQRAGSARRLGGEGAADLAGFMTERETGRADRMLGTFADAMGQPGAAADPITASETMGRELTERRSDLGGERGYGRSAGLRFSDEAMPDGMIDPQDNRPANWTFQDEARALADQADRSGMTKSAETLEVLRSGREAATGAIPIPDDARLRRYTREGLKQLLRSRDIPVSVFYANDDPSQGVVSRNPTMEQLRDRVRRARAAEETQRPNAPPVQIDQEGNLRADQDALGRMQDGREVSPQRLHAVKSVAGDKATSLGKVGETAQSTAFSAFAGRLRNLLNEGVRDASGRRVFKIGDRYHAALSKALEALEFASGVDTRTGKKSGGIFSANPEAVNRFMDDLGRVRQSIQGDASMTTDVRGNILVELDRATQALRLGAVRAYQDFLQQNPVSRNARVFNDENRAMRARLRPLFDSEAEMAAFLRSVDDEGTMKDTEQKVLYGAQTAERLAKDADTQDGQRRFDVFNSLRAGLSNFLLQVMLNPLQRFSERVREGMTKRVADEIARMLTTDDFNALAGELEQAQREGRRMNPRNLTPGARRAVGQAIAQTQQLINDPASAELAARPRRSVDDVGETAAERSMARLRQRAGEQRILDQAREQSRNLLPPPAEESTPPPPGPYEGLDPRDELGVSRKIRDRQRRRRNADPYLPQDLERDLAAREFPSDPLQRRGQRPRGGDYRPADAIAVGDVEDLALAKNLELDAERRRSRRFENTANDRAAALDRSRAAITRLENKLRSYEEGVSAAEAAGGAMTMPQRRQLDALDGELTDLRQRLFEEDRRRREQLRAYLSAEERTLPNGDIAYAVTTPDGRRGVFSGKRRFEVVTNSAGERIAVGSEADLNKAIEKAIKDRGAALFNVVKRFADLMRKAERQDLPPTQEVRAFLETARETERALADAAVLSDRFPNRQRDMTSADVQDATFDVNRGERYADQATEPFEILPRITATEAKRELARMAPGADLRVIDRFSALNAKGMAQRTRTGVEAVLNANRALKDTIRHEALHLYKILGVFKDGEWKAMAAQARRWANESGFNPRRSTGEKIEGDDGQMRAVTDADLDEERIAEWLGRGKFQQKSFARRILDRIMGVLRALRSAFTAGVPRDPQAMGRRFQEGGYAGRFSEALGREQAERNGSMPRQRRQ